MTISPGESESFQPLPNRPKSGPFGTLRFHARLFLDFQVATAYRALRGFFASRNSGRILEVGGGFGPYRHLIKVPHYWSLEPYRLEQEFGYLTESVKYDGAHFPFKTGSFDIVFHTEVMEHIYDTRHFLAECGRVLKPGGSMFFTVPFSARYHYQPHDYWRFTPASLRELCRSQALSVVSIAPRGDALVVILNKIMVFALGLAVGRREEGRARLLFRAAWMPVAAVLLPALAAAGQVLLKTGWVKNTDDCLGYSVTCVKAAPLP